MGEVLFREAQRFRQKWIWVLLIAILVVTVGALLSALPHLPTRAVPLFTAIAVGTATLMLVLCWVFWRAELVVQVRDDGLRLRFSPFHRRWREFPLAEISGHQAKHYRPLAEYGGWGIRITLGGKVAYNVSGDEGVLLTLRNGRSVMIGSLRAHELDAALSHAEEHSREKI